MARHPLRIGQWFIAAHRALPESRGEARVSTRLHRIALNRALNHRARAGERLRRASQSFDDIEREAHEVAPARRPASAEVVASPLAELEATELKRRLVDCLKKLPGAWRAVLALRDGESLSYQEIAARLNTALGTVRSRLARARLSLRRCVEGSA